MGYDDIAIKIATGLTCGVVTAFTLSIPIELIIAYRRKIRYSHNDLKQELMSEKVMHDINQTLDTIIPFYASNGLVGPREIIYPQIANNLHIFLCERQRKIHDNEEMMAIATTRAVGFIPGVICGVFTANKLLDKLHNLSR